MALEPTIAAAAAAAPHPQDLPQGSSGTLADFRQILDQEAHRTARTQEAGPPLQSLQQLATPRSDSIGHQLLDSLERFGGRLQELQKLNGRPVRSGPVLPAGPGALLNPMTNPPFAAKDGGLKAPATANDRLGVQYDAIFDESMARQAKLFGLVIEVDLGRSVASTATSTAKTLLTQSG